MLSSDLHTASLGHHVCPRNPLKGCKAQATMAFLTQGVKLGGDQPGRNPTQVGCLPIFPASGNFSPLQLSMVCSTFASAF